ncbi:MAG TPA: carbohydrate porin [Usitatibacter sp.]|nr:carbohydrate porin [Usitatibacter sp.]
MFPFRLSVGAFALALLPTAATAASDADLASIRSEIRELKAAYEARIEALERRLREAESRGSAATSAAPSMPPAPASAASAFNPAISAILTGTYAHLKRDPRLFAIPGFDPGGEVGPGRRGFGIGESELVFTANVDPHFSAKLVLAVTPEDTVGVEEAYGEYVGAPFGIGTRFGRFLSGIGYLNEQHAHAWDFVDAPLPYQAFLGGRYANDGLQLKWVAPIDHFVELGAEAGNGDAYPGSERNRNGLGSAAVFAHTGGDLGTSNSWRAGLSYLRARSEVDDGASATSRLAVADFVWKYAPQGNSRERAFTLQGEYFQGRIREAARQAGWYLQGVYKFLPEWRVGLRHDRLDPRGVGDSTDEPRRSSAMVDYNPSEFSRIRLQFTRSRLQPDIADNQWFLQYILSLGAHGAHRY